MKGYRSSKLTVVVIIGMTVLFWQAAQANTTLLSGSFNAADAEYHLGSFTFQAPVDGQLLINMDNPDGSADGEIVFTNITTGLRYNDGLFYGTTDYPLFNPQTWPCVRITQGRVHSLYVLPVLAVWGSCDYDVSYVSRRGTQNSGTNSITITYIRRPLTQAGAELLVSLTSDPFESNSESATFDAGNGGWLLLDLLQSGTGGGNHSVYLNGRGIEYNQVGHPPRVMGVHTAVEVGAGTHNLMIRHEDNAWGDNSGVRRTDVYFIPYPFETYYVDADAKGAYDGSSWADAYEYLTNALTVAMYGDEIRVAQGIYKPTEYVPPPPPPPPPGSLPGKATDPYPADGATNVSTISDLSWMAGLRATSHDVYFGTSSSPPFIGNQIATMFDPGTMNESTSYYWRIDELNSYGTTTGDIWSFTTTTVPPPPPPPPPPSLEDSNGQEILEPAVDRTATFQLINGVVIKGGYAGFGESEPDVRDPNTNETILSGDLLGNDGPDFVNYEDNSYHVVTGSETDETAVLDGFTITAGNADGVVGDYYNRCGAGMFNASGSPTVINCTFSRNSAAQDGGGLYNRQNSSPTVTNCKFIGNSAEYGGGMYHRRNSNSTIKNCTFSVNYARTDGGGMFIYESSSPILTNCTFIENSAEDNGGGMRNENSSSPTLLNCTFIRNTVRMDGGGGMNNYYASNPTVINCTFSENSGGGMCNYQSCSPTVTNCTFINNRSGRDGGGMRNQNDCNPVVTNCTFSGNKADYGGGMFNGYSGPRIVNCIFGNNMAQNSGGGLFNWYASSPILTNCTFSGNMSPAGNALACDSLSQMYPSSLQIANSILWNGDEGIWNNDNSVITITYSDVQGGWLGEGNIDADPFFVVPEYLGPMACWKLDETGGTKAYDSVGSNHGNVYGALWADGLVDGALSFDGLNDYVSIPGNAELNNLNEITLEAWICPRRDAHWHILDKGDGDKRIYAEGNTLTLDGRVRYTGEHAFARSASHTLSLNTWQHVALTWSRADNTTRLYHNGVETHYAIRTIGTGDVLDDRSHLWTIGARGALGEVTFFDGLIDEAAIYDRVLSPEEIRENYLAGLSGQGHPDIAMPDYHLLEGSPCINTGDPDYIAGPNETDIDGKPRIIGGRIDMGAYEFNHNPIADAGQDQTVEAQAPWGATVTLDGSGSSDADSTPGTNDDINDFNWYLLDPCNPNADVLLGNGEIIDCSLPIGEYIVLLEVIDRAGASDTNKVTIIVQDTTPPTITCPGVERMVAYNDCVYSSGDQYIANNVTTYGIGSGFAGSTSGPLVDHVTGDDMDIMITLTESGGVNWESSPANGGSDCAIGTDAYNTFGGIADMTGVIYYGSAGWWVDLTFTGLDPTTEYTFATSAARNSYSGRLTIYTLTGADTYTNASTIGVDVLAENKVRFNTGDNHNEGYVARWTGITVTDGSFTVRAEADPCSTDGHKAYSFDVFMLEGVLPGDVTLECPADTNVAAIGSATATDTCGTVTITHSDQWQTSCGNAGTLARTWTATDESGNSSTCVQIITVVDTTPPVITCPPNVTLQCPADTSVEANGSATATDTCGTVTITHSDQWQPGCGNTGTLVRTWTATDECGNSSSCVQIITVVDTTPPVITCPPDVTLECPADTSVEANGSATASDTCGSVAIVHSDLWQPGCGNTGTVTRTWTATDECGNSSSCVQVITVVDTTPPDFELSVSPTMLWPPDHKMYEITPSWTVSDDCVSSPDVSLVGIVTNEGDNTIGDGHTTNDIQINEDGSIYLRSERSGTGTDRIYTITYQAVDDCGNTTVRSAIVSIPHDFKVLARIASRWLWSGPAGRIPEDLNGDGFVNLADVARFAGNWTK